MKESPLKVVDLLLRVEMKDGLNRGVKEMLVNKEMTQVALMLYIILMALASPGVDAEAGVASVEEMVTIAVVAHLEIEEIGEEAEGALVDKEEEERGDLNSNRIITKDEETVEVHPEVAVGVTGEDSVGVDPLSSSFSFTTKLKSITSVS